MGEETLENTLMGRLSLKPDQNVAKTPNSWAQDLSPTHEDHRARFYEHYRKEAEEYDKETIKKYDEDLNTTLIFVSFVRGSGPRANRGRRLVCSPLSPPHSSSSSTLSSSRTRMTRLQLSSASSSTRSTTPPSATMFPPSHNGLALHTPSSMSKPSSSQVSPLHSSPPLSRCLESSG